MHIFYTTVKNELLINLLIWFSSTQPSWPLKVFCKGEEEGLLFNKIKSIFLTLACHFEINVISPGYKTLYLPPFCPALLLGKPCDNPWLRCGSASIASVLSPGAWSQAQWKKPKNLWKEIIALFLKLEVIADTSWIVNNFAIETGLCIKVKEIPY